MTENKHRDEIDLVTVFESIKKATSTVLQKLKELVQFSLLNIKSLVVFVLIGVGISLGVFFLKKTVYTTDLTVSHARLNNSQCADLLNSLTQACNRTSELAKKLDIDSEIASQIKGISYQQLSNSAKDSLTKMSDFKIIVSVYNPLILDSLQSRILHFLESNEYAKKRKEINRLYLDKLEERTKKQILSIDSLRNIVDKSIIPKSLGNGIIMGESIDPVKVYQESMNLYQSQLNIEHQKELNNSFEIVVGFSTAIPVSDIKLNMVVGVICGYLIGLLWLFRRKTKSTL